MGSKHVRRGVVKLLGSSLITSAAFVGACTHTDSEPDEEPVQAQSEALFGWDTSGPTSRNTPVGLALEIDDGQGVPLQLREGQRFFIDQIDLRVGFSTDVDEGVLGLALTGDFSDLDWRGTELVDADFVGLPNADGTFTRRRFYRGAKWMERSSLLAVWQVDGAGRPTAVPWLLSLGKDDRRRHVDSFFVRRLRAIQWTYDCASPDDCDAASSFQEEAIVELRNSRHSWNARRLRGNTVALQVRWSLDPSRAWNIPVEQIDEPDYDYNFDVDIEALTPPGSAGFYEPGQTIDFRFTLLDGSGNALHPEGRLPTYNEATFGPNPAGIQYYRAFFDPTATYYRRKHRERMMAVQLVGPAQDIQPVRTIAELEQFLTPSDAMVLATPDRDGMHVEAQLFPPAHNLFGGAFFPTGGGWDAPVSDTVRFSIPDDAEAGTYRVTFKGRRTFLGQDIPRSRTVELQVGTATHTSASLDTGPCTSCHSQGGQLDRVLHANDDRAACGGCHVPLSFELEGPVFVRTHFIHSRSDRFDAQVSDCSNCHLTQDSISRVSKAACLSCHTSYPDSHVQSYGPIVNMYVGGDRESFDSCTESCHQNHPRSGL